jgi:hypothetical protein
VHASATGTCTHHMQSVCLPTNSAKHLTSCIPRQQPADTPYQLPSNKIHLLQSSFACRKLEQMLATPLSFGVNNPHHCDCIVRGWLEHQAVLQLAVCPFVKAFCSEHYIPHKPCACRPQPCSPHPQLYNINPHNHSWSDPSPHTSGPEQRQHNAQIRHRLPPPPKTCPVPSTTPHYHHPTINAVTTAALKMGTAAAAAGACHNQQALAS